MTEMASSLLDKLQKVSPVASLLLAASIIFTSYTARTAVDSQSTHNNSVQIQMLSQQVTALQTQVAEQNVLKSQIENLKDSQKHTQDGVDKLNSKFDAFLISRSKH